MALYISHSIFHLARLLYVGPETFGPYYVLIFSLLNHVSLNVSTSRIIVGIVSWTHRTFYLAISLSLLNMWRTRFNSGNLNVRSYKSGRFYVQIYTSTCCYGCKIRSGAFSSIFRKVSSTLPVTWVCLSLQNFPSGLSDFCFKPHMEDYSGYAVLKPV